MPSADIDTSLLEASLQATRADKSLDDYSTVVATSQGLAMIEIQGDLNIPKCKPAGLSEEESKLFGQYQLPTSFSSRGEIIDVVKVGRLEIEADFKKATLFISTTQRLVGKVETLDPPLGVLKTGSDDSRCELIDIIKSKIIFKNRPLPIM